MPDSKWPITGSDHVMAEHQALWSVCSCFFQFGLNVLAFWRRDEPVHEGLGDLKLELGDAMLVV